MEDPYGLKMDNNPALVIALAQHPEPTKLNNIQECFSEMMKFQKNQSQLCHLDSVLELHDYF